MFKFTILIVIFILIELSFSHDIPELRDEATSNQNKFECEKSVTVVSGKLAACRDRLVFEETFDRDIDTEESSWTREIFLPLDPDYEFSAYRELPNNLQVTNGTLEIIPSLLDDIYYANITLYGRLDLAESCTGSLPLECKRRAIGHSVLPPVISARLTTKQSFHFRYGKIEIRARFPKGDWIYPELWLERKQRSYSVGYAGGRVILGMSRGNENLLNSEGKELGSAELEFGLRGGPKGNMNENKVTKSAPFGSSWSDDFHVYTTVWNEDGFRFEVDGHEVGRIGRGERSSSNNYSEEIMAPFDINEFYISVGLGVGGIRVFPDGTTSGRYSKPWRNIEAKAMMSFWRARDLWLPSWGKARNDEASRFVLDYIRVWTV